MGFVSAGVPVRLATVGKGEPVIFLHSGAGRGSDWARLIEWIGDGLRCVAVDMFGYGDTPWPADRPWVTIDNQANLLLELAGVLGGSVHVVGHSFGGAVALRAALLSAEAFETLTLIEPQAVPLLKETNDPLYDETLVFRDRFDALHSESKPDAAMRVFVDHYSGDGFFDNLPATAQQELVSLSGVVAMCWSAVLTNRLPLAELRRVNTSTLVIRGSATLPAEQRMCEIILDTVPRSHENVIPEASHMSPMTHPKQVATALNRHLPSHTSRP